MKRLLILLLAAVAMPALAQAHKEQAEKPGKKDLGLSVHAGGALPVGGFADRAGIGFNVGLRKTWSLKSPVNLFVNIDAIYNGLSSDMKDVIANADHATYFETSKYLNIPLTAGVNLSFDTPSGLDIWGELGVGANLRRPLGMNDIRTEVPPYGGYFHTREKFKSGVSVATQAGVGVMFNDRYSVGMHYYYLGDAKNKYNLKVEDTTEQFEPGVYSYELDNTVKTSPQNVFMVRLGYHF